MAKDKSKNKLMLAAAIGVAAYFFMQSQETPPPPPVDFNSGDSEEKKKMDWQHFFKEFWPKAKSLGISIYEAWQKYKAAKGTTTYDVNGKNNTDGFAGIGAVEPYVKLTFANNEEVAKYFSKLPTFPSNLTRRQKPGLNGFLGGYRWKPSASQRKAFAEKMKDEGERQAYEQRKADKAAKKRAGSKFDYSTAGGNYKPTEFQNKAAFKFLSKGNLTMEQQEACNMVISAYSLNEPVHHDYIHIVNEMSRRENNLSGIINFS